MNNCYLYDFTGLKTAAKVQIIFDSGKRNRRFYLRFSSITLAFFIRFVQPTSFCKLGLSEWSIILLPQ